MDHVRTLIPSVQMTLSMADPEDVPDGFENDSYDDEVGEGSRSQVLGLFNLGTPPVCAGGVFVLPYVYAIFIWRTL